MSFMRRGRVALAARLALAMTVAATLAAVAACSEDEGTGPGGEGLTLDTGARVRASVGAGGDTLTTVSSSGVRYTLGISDASVMDAVEVTVTPVTAARKSPIAEAGLVAAVQLEPSGTMFASPAELTIELPAGTSTEGLVGFLAEGDGDAPHLVPITVVGNEVRLLVPHFSVAGVVRDAESIPEPPPSSRSALFEHLLARAMASLNGQPADVQALATLFGDWFQLAVKPALVAAAGGAATDGSTLAAQAELARWNAAIGRLAFLELDAASGQQLIQLLTAESEESVTLNTAVFTTAIARSNAACVAQPATNPGEVLALQAASNALFWQRRAELFLGPAPPFDLATILAGLCLQVEYESASLPQQTPVGQTVPLQVRVGLKRGTNAVDFGPGLLDVEVQPVGATVATGQPTTFPTDVNGFVATQLAVTQPAVVVNIHSCGSLAFGTYLPLLCKDTLIVRNSAGSCAASGGRVVQGNVAIRSAGDALAAQDIAEITGALRISATADLPCLRRVRGALTITTLSSEPPFAAPGIVRLAALDTAGQFIVSSAAGLTRLELPALSALFDGPRNDVEEMEISFNPDLAAVVLGSFTVDLLNVRQNPRLASLATGALRINRLGVSLNAQLVSVTATSLTGFNDNDIGTPGAYDIGTNPELSTLSLGTITGSRLSLMENPALQSLSGIASNSTLQFFRFGGNGFTMNVALAFANRITLTAGLCEFGPNGVAITPCPVGPPWRLP